MIPKYKSEFIDGDKKLFFMDAKAMNTLYWFLSINDFNLISSCKNVRDIWHVLETTNEGTNQVK